MRFLALLLLALSLPAGAQTAQQLTALSPQLVVFAGSDANLQALANGLTLGQPVTLVTADGSGLVQIATFTPPNTLAGADVSRALEQARSNLIARGITQPSAQQVATALMGGTILTASGPVSLTGVLTNSMPQNAVSIRNEFTGAFAGTTTGPFGSATNLQALSTGLRQGTPITLTGVGPAGSTQTVTFNAPGGARSVVDANLALQLAAQTLASVGLTNPTPAQVQAALLGGTVAVPGGNVQLAGVLQAPAPSTSNSSLFGTSNSPFITSGTGGTTPSQPQPFVGSTPSIVGTHGIPSSAPAAAAHAR